MHVFGPSLGLLRLRDGTALYEVRVGLGAVAMVLGMATFLLSSIVLAAGGAGWLVAGGGAMLGAVALQVRSERRKAPMVAAEVVRALHQAG